MLLPGIHPPDAPVGRGVQRTVLPATRWRSADKGSCIMPNESNSPGQLGWHEIPHYFASLPYGPGPLVVLASVPKH